MHISKKDNLYKLVKSLSKNEKRYFQEFLKSNTSPTLYKALFNQIDKQSKHDTDEIKLAFDSKANQLPVIKSYLSKLILKSLKNFHQNSGNDEKIQNSFLEIDLLLKKDLLDQAEFEIQKTIEICRESEKLIPLLQALDFQKFFLISKFGSSSHIIQKDLNQIIDEQNQTLGKLYNLHQYELLQANFYDQFHQSSGLNPTVYTSLHTNPLLTSDKSPESAQARLLQAEILYSMHIFKDKNYPEARRSIEKAIKYLELNPHLIGENPQSYLSLLNQEVQLLLHLKNFIEVPQLLDKIRQSSHSFNASSGQTSLRRIAMETYQLELQLYAETRNFAKAHQLIPQIQGEFKHLLSPVLRQWRTVLQYEIMRVYFFEENYFKAIQIAQTILTAEHSKREAETLIQTAFLLVLIRLKQRNFLELKRVLKSIEKIFKQTASSNRKPSKTEKQILKLLQIYPENILTARRHHHLAKQLKTVKATQQKNDAAGYEQYIDWLGETFLSQSEQD